MKLRKINLSGKLLMLILSATTLVSCKDNNVRPEPDFREEYVEEVVDNPEEVKGDIMEVLQGVPELSHFTMELGASDFPEFTLNDDQFTIFAPSNEVFPPVEKSQEVSDAKLERSEVIHYHISKDAYSLEELRQIAVTDSVSYINSASGEKLYISLEGNEIVITGNSGQKAQIVRTMPASNGVIYVINKSLFPVQTSSE